MGDDKCIQNHFQNPSIECIPNQVVDPKDFNVDQVYYRMDLLFNEIRLTQQLEVGKCSIVTNKAISQTILLNNKSRIGEVVYIITEDDDPDFAHFLESNKIKYSLITRLPKDQMSDKKVNYIDLEHAAIMKLKENDEEEKEEYHSETKKLSRRRHK